MDKQDVLRSIITKFQKGYDLRPVIATEIEFYLHTNDANIGKTLLAKIKEECSSQNIAITRADEEDGNGQYEVALDKNRDIIKIAEDTKHLKNIIKTIAESLDTKADFSALPFPTQPGSGLHIHLSLHDENNINLFSKIEGEESSILQNSVAGLCATMLESMIFFAPNTESYKRYNREQDRSNFYNMPVNISWGGNNRTVAIRIPTSTKTPENRHIEHRVSGADADPYLAITAILGGCLHGITQKTPLNLTKIYGNAWEDQYELMKFPKTLEDAQNLHRESEILNL